MKKAVITAVALTLVACMAIGGTLAWLMDKTVEVKNTFTTSDVSIELTETKPDQYTAKMVPGLKIAKDPKVTVKAGSEDCWLFVKIVKSSNFDSYMTVAYNTTEWTAVESGTDYVVYGREAKAGDSFYILAGGDGELANGYVTVKDSVTKAMMETAKTANPTLSFTAYAIQKLGFEGNMTGAWAEAKTLG